MVLLSYIAQYGYINRDILLGRRRRYIEEPVRREIPLSFLPISTRHITKIHMHDCKTAKDYIALQTKVKLTFKEFLLNLRPVEQTTENKKEEFQGIIGDDQLLAQIS